MALEIIAFKMEEEERFKAVRVVREKVFVEEQKVDRTAEFDRYEKDCMHYQLLLNGETIGTARWREVGGMIKLERFALLKEFRNLKYGAILLEKVVHDVQGKGKTIYLHAQLAAVSFYERGGFSKVGLPFTECNIEHFKMVK